jgi:hypothetical protein
MGLFFIWFGYSSITSSSQNLIGSVLIIVGVIIIFSSSRRGDTNDHYGDPVGSDDGGDDGD